MNEDDLFAQAIQAARLARNLNLEQAGAELGKSGWTISRWEKGHPPDADGLRALTRVWGVSRASTTARPLPVLAPGATCMIGPGTVCVLHDIAKKKLSLSDVQQILEAIAADSGRGKLLEMLLALVKTYAK